MCFLKGLFNSKIRGIYETGHVMLHPSAYSRRISRPGAGVELEDMVTVSCLITMVLVGD